MTNTVDRGLQEPFLEIRGQCHSSQVSYTTRDPSTESFNEDVMSSYSGLRISISC